MPNQIKKLYALCTKDGKLISDFDKEDVPHLCIFENKKEAISHRWYGDKIVRFNRQENKISGKQQIIWAVELDISYEAAKPEGSYWTVHQEEDADGKDRLCVYRTKKEAIAAAKGRDHKSRVVKFLKER